MSTGGVAKFVSIVGVHFPRYDSGETDEAIWQASLTKLLSRFDDAVLMRAAERIIATRDPKRDGKWFPAPKECIAACEWVRPAVEAAKRPMLDVDKAPKEYSPERHKLALDCLGTELGIEAVKARWHVALYYFIYRNARMPQGTEIDAVKRASSEFFDAVKACERGDFGPVSPSLARLGKSIAQRVDTYVKGSE